LDDRDDEVDPEESFYDTILYSAMFEFECRVADGGFIPFRDAKGITNPVSPIAVETAQAAKERIDNRWHS
jgi:hypothetical protein